MAAPAEQSSGLHFPEHEAVGGGAQLGQLGPFSVREGGVGVLLQEFLVPHHIRCCLATARNVPQGGVVQAIERGEVCLKCGRGLLPTGGSTYLNGTEHNVIKRLLGRLGNELQTQVDVLR
jgi:hypothetical protein